MSLSWSGVKGGVDKTTSGRFSWTDKSLRARKDEGGVEAAMTAGDDQHRAQVGVPRLAYEVESGEGGLVDVDRRRQASVAQREHSRAGVERAGGGIEAPDHRLRDRHRDAPGVVPERSSQRLNLELVAQARTGAVGEHRVDLLGRHARI